MHGLQGSVAVAWSGGIDSSFLLHASVTCCRYPVYALTADSLFVHPDDRNAISVMADVIAARFVTVDWDPLFYPEIVRNDALRCYYCKYYMYKKMLGVCDRLGISYLMDGTQKDDLAAHRPGLAAIEELGIITPLSRFGLDKRDIRHLSLLKSLESWGLRSQSCLATRIETGKPLEAQTLLFVGKIESMLSDWGVEGSRFRICCGKAVLTVPETGNVEREALLNKVKTVVAGLGIGSMEITVECL